MAEIVSLADGQAYLEMLREVSDILHDMESSVHSAMVNLALTGKWKKWSDEQPIGTIFNFSEEMLRDTGDKRVDALCELMDKIIEVRERI